MGASRPRAERIEQAASYVALAFLPGLLAGLTNAASTAKGPPLLPSATSLDNARPMTGAVSSVIQKANRL